MAERGGPRPSGEFSRRLLSLRPTPEEVDVFSVPGYAYVAPEHRGSQRPPFATREAAASA